MGVKGGRLQKVPPKPLARRSRALTMYSRQSVSVTDCCCVALCLWPACIGCSVPMCCFSDHPPCACCSRKQGSMTQGCYLSSGQGEAGTAQELGQTKAPVFVQHALWVPSAQRALCFFCRCWSCCCAPRGGPLGWLCACCCGCGCCSSCCPAGGACCCLLLLLVSCVLLVGCRGALRCNVQGARCTGVSTNWLGRDLIWLWPCACGGEGGELAGMLRECMVRIPQRRRAREGTRRTPCGGEQAQVAGVAGSRLPRPGAPSSP